MWHTLTNEQRPMYYVPILLKRISGFGIFVRLVIFNEHNVAYILWEDDIDIRNRITAKLEVNSSVLINCPIIYLDRSHLEMYLERGIKWEWRTIRPEEG